MRKLRLLRIIIASVAAELLALIALFPLLPILIASPTTTLEAKVVALRHAGAWVGPLAGLVFCLIWGWWAARRLDAHRELNSLAVGGVVAAMDLALLAVAGAPMASMYLASAAARVLGGYLGGKLASRRRPQPALAR